MIRSIARHFTHTLDVYRLDETRTGTGGISTAETAVALGVACRVKFISERVPDAETGNIRTTLIQVLFPSGTDIRTGDILRNVSYPDGDEGASVDSVALDSIAGPFSVIQALPRRNGRGKVNHISVNAELTE